MCNAITICLKPVPGIRFVSMSRLSMAVENPPHYKKQSKNNRAGDLMQK